MATQTQRFADFSKSVTTTDLAILGTSVSVGAGSLFPALAAGQYFYAVLADSIAAPTRREIIKVTQRIGNGFTTIERGIAGTTVQTWPAGTHVELRPVAQMFRDTFEEAVGYTTTSHPTVFDFMTPAQIADVRARTFLVDVSASLMTAFIAGVGYFPAGGYLCNSSVANAAAERLTIQGESSAKVEIRFAAGVAGMALTFSDPIQPPSVRGVTITTLNPGPGVAGTGLSIVMTPTAPTTYRQGPIINDVVVRGQTPTTMGWSKNVYLEGLWYPTICGLTAKGYSAAGAGLNSYETLYGVHINKCMAPFITCLYLQHINDGIYEDSTALACEGFQITQFEMVGVRTGMTFGAGLGALSPQPGNYIGEGHINASYRGIDYRQRDQTEINNVSFYRTPATTEAWIGVQLADSHQNVITNCFFGNTSADTTPCFGVFLAGTSSGNIVSNLTANSFTAAGSFVQLANTASRNVIEGDTFQYGTDGTIWTEVTLSTLTGTGNRFRDKRAPIAEFTNGDTTPSVDNAVSGAFQTANAGATSITRFDGGYVGQEFQLLINDSFTTIVNDGVNIALAPGANVAPIAGDILEFRNYGGSPNLWRCVNRYSNDGQYRHLTTSGRFQWKQGADIASANDLTLGSDGNCFIVTGATQINRIVGTGWQAGSIVMLIFASTPTVKHGQASGGANLTINLGGSLDFIASAGNYMLLQLRADSTWNHIGGSFEKKTWTPALSFGGGATGMTGTFAGTYEKDHDGYVTANGMIQLTAKGSSTGDAVVTLPLTVRNSSDSIAPPSFYLSSVTFSTMPIGFPNGGAANMALNQINGGTGAASTLTHANFADNSVVFFSLKYRAT